MSQIEINQKKILRIFSESTSNEETYKRIIALGESSPNLPIEEKVEENRVHGCQSQLFITHSGTKERLEFKIDSDALISRGLATILINIFNGASAEEIIKTPITLFKEIDLFAIISPTRVTGVEALEKRIKQIAVNYLI